MTAVATLAPSRARSARERLRHWWLARLPATDEHVLTQRNLYVLPTRPGWMLAVTLGLLLLGSINYQLNLGYLLTFLLTGAAGASVLVGHANLRGVRSRVRMDGDAFAGRPLPVRVALQAPGRRTRWAVALAWAQSGADPVVTDIAGGVAEVTVPLVLPRRGRHRLPALGIETRYPLGVARIWSWWHPAPMVTVWPAPEPSPPPLPTAASTPSDAKDRTPPDDGVYAVTSADLPDGVRPYRAGDSPGRVLWKKAARHDGDPAGWLVREATPTAGDTRLWLDDAACGLSDVEARRSRLCAWVLQADAHGLAYGLRLPGCTIEPGTGPAHRRHCLEALACH